MENPIKMCSFKPLHSVSTDIAKAFAATRSTRHGSGSWGWCKARFLNVKRKDGTRSHKLSRGQNSGSWMLVVWHCFYEELYTPRPLVYWGLWNHPQYRYPYIKNIYDPFSTIRLQYNHRDSTCSVEFGRLLCWAMPIIWPFDTLSMYHSSTVNMRHKPQHGRLNAIVGDMGPTEPSDGSENPKLLKHSHLGIAKNIQS